LNIITKIQRQDDDDDFAKCCCGACAEEQFGVEPLTLNLCALILGLAGTLLIGRSTF